MTNDHVKKDKAEKPGGPNFWEVEDERHLFTHCKGYSDIPKIAKTLGRTELSVARRIALAMSKREGAGSLEDRLACIMHSLDLVASGGKFNNVTGNK
jgi:hypothetical protein